MLIRLTRKLAERVDGVDLSRSREGDILDLSPRDAELLVAEGWAVSFDTPPRPDVGVAASNGAASSERAALSNGAAPTDGAESSDGADSAARLTTDQLRRVREQMERRHFEQQHERRIEDRIREELHDARARIVPPSDRDEPV